MNAHGTPLTRETEHRLGESLVYDLVHFLGSPFAYDVAGFENIQGPGPAIFVANHHGSIGPLAIMLSIPLRFYPWIVADMMDPVRAPKYMYDDFIHKDLHLGGKVGMAFSTFLTKITRRLFKSIGAIAIDTFGGYSPDGFRHSLRLLHEGKNLLIFPENSLLPIDPTTETRPFMPGFATLCNIFQLGQSYSLPVYPIAVHPASETISIGKSEFLRSQRRNHEAIDEFCQRLEDRVKAQFLELQKLHAASLP